MKKIVGIVLFIVMALPAMCQSGGIIGENQTVFTHERPEPIGGGAVAGATSYQWEYTDDWEGWYHCTGVGSTGLYFSPPELISDMSIWYRRTASVGSERLISNIVKITAVSGAIIPGTIGFDHTIQYGEIAGMLNSLSEARTNLSDTYITYQWQQSTDEVNWTDVVPNWTDECGGYTDNGHSDIFQQSTPLYTTTYFRRKAMAGSHTAYSNTVTITLDMSLRPGVILGSISIEAGGIGGMLFSEYDAEGIGPIDYQWQQSTDQINWTDVVPNWTDECGGYTDYGHNNIFQQSTPLYKTTYFRRKAIMGNIFAYSNVVTITVVSHLTPGVIGTNRTIEWNGIAGMLYSEEEAWTDQSSLDYQWQQSTDQVNWTDVLPNWTDECGGYTDNGHSDIFQQSTPLQQTTYFRRKVTAGSYTAYSNVICITVRPAPIVAGKIGNNQTIDNNTVPQPFVSQSDAMLADSSAVTITYEWQISTNQTQWTALPSSNSSAYTYDAPLTVKSYFRRKAFYGSQTVYSNIITVTITYPPLSGGRIGMDMH